MDICPTAYWPSPNFCILHFGFCSLDGALRDVTQPMLSGGDATDITECAVPKTDPFSLAAGAASHTNVLYRGELEVIHITNVPQGRVTRYRKGHALTTYSLLKCSLD